ncbi:asparagine synthase (glutamine-hydrolyzing) [Paraflavitalea pollutisoli]|uniref:asparagine synthase (glutamine-hydrolyzing) n=1 Tax=Paraflavitalea pollutisoli TaxID=3034143 RepID=UPI0023EDEA99|nr:asparagine synthase (glutamine-hydrolyzing) [Paraflavitalea sp. H1-2-19X]
MCGIAGIIAAQPGLVSEQAVKGMTDVLAHRGPDGEGCWIDASGRVGLGHRRLSIIDLRVVAGQPMHYLDRFSIVYNGELYNYRELQQSLIKKGYSFHSSSDTEVILAAYAAWGVQCLDYFDGMFAFAIWDDREQRLFAARDRFGEKPFYYYQDEQRFLFASEMKALWAAGVNKHMEGSMLYNYLTLGYIQHPGDQGATFYTGIRKLPARHYLLYDLPTRKLSEHVYWKITLAEKGQSLSASQATEQLDSLLSLSVERRLRSDVPVGTSLSGGLDSATILSYVARSTGRPSRLQSFSAVFPGFERNESAAIAQTANFLGAENYQVEPSSSDLIDDFDRICYHLEEPFQSASVVAQYRVFQLARQYGVTVLLDGQGADELLAGYSKYYPWFWRELYRSDKRLLSSELSQSMDNAWRREWGWKQQVAARFPRLAAAWQIRQRVRSQKEQLDLHPEFVYASGRSHYALPHDPHLNGVLHYNTFHNGLEELLQYADRNSMAHGREVRLPFLFHELVSFVFSLPAKWKIQDGYSKWILRKTMDQRLPAETVWRKDKIGFEPPQKSWMANKRVSEYRHHARSVLVDKGILRSSVLNKKNQPQDSHAADNYDWRYFVAGILLQ